MNKVIIYHQPTNTYHCVNDLEEYMKNMKGNALTLDLIRGVLIDYDEIINTDNIICMESSDLITYK